MLHDLGEVTGRILWRNHAELRARGGRKARDAPMKADAGQHIGNDLDRLALAHARQLAFLEVGVNPQSRCRNDGQEVTSNRRIRAGTGTAVADDAVDRCTDFRIFKVKPRDVAICHGLIEGRLGLLLLTVDDAESTLCCIERGPRFAIRGAGFLVVGIGLLEPLQ